MLKKFLIGTAMAAGLLLASLAFIALPVAASLYMLVAHGPLAAAGTLFVSMCILLGAAHAAFD